ncbi:hypothetical protein [Crenothrix sp.]|uniref:hypothetical protein n=1 Tax=Crenothrix sp. TaxID=3100433 RepID=UPI00374DB13E
MMLLKNWLSQFMELLHSVKDENLQWQNKNQAQQTKLKHAKILAENALAAKLKMKSVQLEHEISLLKIRHDSELSMFKTKCNQDIKDYEQYLNALDKLKKSIQSSYTHLPEAVAFTIHHHAKYLLNKMWEAEDMQQKMNYEMQLITFMTTVHEDAKLQLEGLATKPLPENTLKLIQQ